jgi:hypothetical protein
VTTKRPAHKPFQTAMAPLRLHCILRSDFTRTSWVFISRGQINVGPLNILIRMMSPSISCSSGLQAANSRPYLASQRAFIGYHTQGISGFTFQFHSAYTAAWPFRICLGQFIGQVIPVHVRYTVHVLQLKTACCLFVAITNGSRRPWGFSHRLKGAGLFHEIINNFEKMGIFLQPPKHGIFCKG